MDVRVLYNVEGRVRAKKMAYPAVFISGRNGDPGEKKEGGDNAVLDDHARAPVLRPGEATPQGAPAPTDPRRNVAPVMGAHRVKN